jgi:hypothetical protein
MPTPDPYQLPEDLKTDSEVLADKTFIVDPVQAVGIAFTPKTGNVGGYPLVVTVNDDPKQRHVIRGPEFIMGTLTGAKVKVDATLGGGAEGDKWSVTLLPSSDTYERPRPRVDGDGFLQVRPGGERVLFHFNTLGDFIPFNLAFDGQATGMFFISPAAPNRFSAYTGSEDAPYRAWDLSRFSRAAFHVDQVSLSGTGLNWDCLPFIETTHSLNGRASRTITMGSDGQIGAADAVPWNAQQAWIELGAGAASVDTHTREVAPMFSRVRFGLLVSLNLEDFASGPSAPSWPSAFELQIKALVW